MTTPITVAVLPPAAPIDVSVSLTGDRGPQGDVGPANTLAIGTVASGATAAATITGTAPSQTLNLTLPVGPQGATGSQGATGAQGPAGPANTLSVGTVTTGAAGSSVAATITGTSPSQTLNLTIPRGDTGSVGSTGATGATGQQGATGATGARGAPGKGNDTIWRSKSFDEFVQDSATLVDDSELQFPAAANSTYFVTMLWRFEESSAHRSKWSLRIPSGATISQALHQFAGPDDYRPEYHLPPAVNMPELVLPFSPGAGKQNDGVNTLVAVVRTGSTAGTVAFQFAQATATTSGNESMVLQDSWLRAELVAPDPAAPASQATGVNVAAPSANVTLTTSSKRYQFLEPSASIDVTLPAISAGNEGLSFIIKNEDGTSNNTITVKNAAASTVVALYSQEAAELVCTGSAWKFVKLGATY